MKSKFTLLAILLTIVLLSPGTGAPIEQYAQEPVFNSKFFYREWGAANKITVVLCHGTGDLGADIWDGVIRELEKKYHVYAFDLPGFARSEKKNLLYNPESYARFIKWFIDKKTKGPVYLVGYSMGGALCVYFAGTYPERVKRLVIIDAAGILHRAAFTKNALTSQMGQDLKGMDKVILEKPIGALKRFLNSTIESVDSKLMPQNIDDSLNSKEFREKILSGNPKRISGAALLHTDFTRVIERIQVPTSIIWGAKDPIAPLRVGTLLAASIPESSLTIIPGAGHEPMTETKKTFNRLLVKALSGEETIPYKKFNNKKTEPGLPDKKLTGRSNINISGRYRSISLKDCNKISISGVVTGTITIENSNVTIQNSSIGPAKTSGLTARNSTVRLTGVSVSGEPAITLYNTKLDMAGCRLTGKSASIKSQYESTVVSSVSRVSSAKTKGTAHRIMILYNGDEF
ncbi:MAG: alpha/beta hydrolase [bacterium]|nr:alpha/beta hydrolase [bacterium]